jgi:hypothetical protein
MASHFLCFVIGNDKGESIGRLCEEFHKVVRAGKMAKQEFHRKALRRSFFLVRAPLAIDRSQDLDCHRAKKIELPSVGCGTKQNGTQRAHDMLIVSGLEEPHFR